MEKQKETILKRQYYLKEVLKFLSKGTSYRIIGWDIIDLDHPLCYRTVLDGFMGPVVVDYMETSITISGETFDKTNSPGCVSEMMDLLDQIKRSMDYDLTILSGIHEKLKKMITDFEEEGIKPTGKS